MADNESRLILGAAAGMFAFLAGIAGIAGLAFTTDQVKDRVDRRVARQVDQRVCQLVPDRCPPPPPQLSRGD